MHLRPVQDPAGGRHLPRATKRAAILLASGGRRYVTDVRRQIAADHRRVAQPAQKNLLRLWCSSASPPRTKRSSLPPRGVAYPFAPPSGSFVGNDKHTRKKRQIVAFASVSEGASEEKAGREPTQGQQRKLKLSISRKAKLQSTGG